jgi:hypothetical protein
MAKNFLSGLRLANLTSDPVSGSEGELYYNTVSDKVRIFSDGAWRDLSATTSGSLINIDSIQYPDYIAFDTSPESTSASVGTLSWDTGEGNLSLQLTANSNIGIGQEIIIRVNNGEATTLNKGEVVRLSGAQGQRPQVTRAYNLNDTGSALTIGIVNENITAGGEGFVVTQGIVREVDTNAFNEGDILYLSASPGVLTTVKPQAPNHYVFVGVVVKKNASSGRIYVKPQNGYELDELHNVRITSEANNDILLYNSASSIWVNSPSQNIINTASAAAYASASAYTDSSLVPYLTQASASSSYVAQNATGNEYIQDQAAALFNHALHVNASATYDDANNRVIITANAGGGGGGAAVDYQASQPDVTGLAAGSLWIDSDQDAISGLLPATFTRWVKVLSASATTISGLDDNALSLLYVPGNEKVFINGTLLVRGSDYTATTGNTVVLTLAAETTDVIEIHAYEAFQIANTYTQQQIDSKFNNYTRWSKIYSASATTITGVDDYSNSLSYTNNYERVFINGVLVDPSEYTRTSASVITPDEAILSGDVVEVFNIVSAQIGDTYTTSQIDAKYNNRTRWTKTFSASATVISGADDNAINLSYTSGNEEVYLNGILLTPVTDYARTSASVITLSQAVVTNDIIDVVNIAPFNVVNTYSQSQIDAKYNDYTRWTKTLSASATTISGTDNNSTTLSYTPGKEQVYINGSLIMRGTEYTASSGSSIVLTEAAVVDDVIDIVSITPFNIANVYTQTQVDSKVGTNGGMVLINKTDFSASGTINLNNIFSSTYDNYLLKIDYTSSTSLGVSMRMRLSGTDNSSSLYYNQILTADNTTVSASKSNAQTSVLIGYGNTDRSYIDLNVYSPAIARATIGSANLGENLNGTANAFRFFGWGHNVATAYDGLSIFTNTGNITGTVRVYGYRNDV